jgi:alpha-ribazole phosphatase/probable phosphoglycerate mutase
MDFTRLYLIRHGQVVGWDRMRYNGWTDVGLTDVGRSQAKAAAEDLSEVDFAAVYSSDLFRAKFGGEAVADGRRGLSLTVEPAFRELHFGLWEGLTFNEVDARYPGAMEARRLDIVDYRPPGAESVGDFFHRVTTALTELLKTHPAGNVALVSHSGVNRIILLTALGVSPESIWRIHQDFGCLNVVDYYPQIDMFMVRLVNQPNRVFAESPDIMQMLAAKRDRAG